MFDFSWQDVVLSIGNLLFFVALLPSVFSKDKPALATSALTASILTLFAFVYASLGLWFAVLSVSLAACGWWVLAWQKFVEGKK